MKKQNKTLTLIVKKVFFDQILSGKKKEDYREIKDYWNSRFINRKFIINDLNHLKVDLITHPKKYDFVKIKNGYSRTAPTLVFKMDKIIIGLPKEELGGYLFYKDDVSPITDRNEFKRVFIIKFGPLNSASNIKE